ncbi:DMT family transporter [bacterium]|nr:DMT family transporter [bacterium]
MPYFAVFFSLLFYGLSTTLQKKALLFVSLKTLLKIHAYIVGAIYIGIWFFFSKNFSPSDYFYPLLGAITSAIGFILYYEALKKTDASIVSTISSIFAIITVALSITFLKETFYIKYVFGLFFIILGLILLNIKKSKTKSNVLGIILAFIGMIMWGLWGFFSKVSYNYVGEAEILGAFGVIGPIFFLIYAKRLKEDKKEISSKGEIIALISVIVTIIASILCYFSLAFLPAAFVIPIISAYPVITAISSAIILKEKFTPVKMLYLVLIIIGIIIFFL